MSASPDLPLVPPAAPSRGERAYPFLLAVLLLLGALLRVRVWMFARSFWSDEAMLALGISGRSFARALEPLPYAQVAPPGFVLLVRACEAAFGSSERALRLVSLVAGVVSLPLFASVARRLLSRTATLFAVVAFVVLEPLGYYANELKPYALDVAIALGILRAALGALEAPGSVRRGVAHAVGGGVLVWCSYPAVFGLAATALVFGLRAIRRRLGVGAIGRIMLVALVWAVAFAALYQTVAKAGASSDDLHAYWRNARAPWPASRKAIAWFVEAYFAAFRDPVGFLQPALAAAAAIVGSLTVSRRSLARGALLLLPIGVTLVASRVAGYPFSSRLILFLVPAALLATAAGLDELRRIPGRPVWLAAAIVVLMLQPVVAAVTVARHPLGREEIRPVLAALLPRLRPGDAVYVYEYGHPQFRWYAGHGFALPDGVDVIRGAVLSADVKPGAPLTEASSFRFPLPISLNEALSRRGPGGSRPRVWALFTHVITWKGTDEERVARGAFLLSGYEEDVAASAGLSAAGASAALYVRPSSAELPTPR